MNNQKKKLHSYSIVQLLATHISHSRLICKRVVASQNAQLPNNAVKVLSLCLMLLRIVSYIILFVLSLTFPMLRSWT